MAYIDKAVLCDMDNELYDLAFAFKKARLWKKLWDSQLFAVAHSDGSIGYCCVMGRAGKHLALAVYPGPEGLHAYRMMSLDWDDLEPYEMKEKALSQDCVMVSLQNKIELQQEEQEALAAYCADRGVTLRGQKACPQFERFRPLHHPWFLDDPRDILHMKEALMAALDVSRRLETRDAAALGFTDGPPYEREIPLLTLQKKRYAWRLLSLPPPLQLTYPSIGIPDDITMKRLKSAKKTALDWAACIFMNPEPSVDEAHRDPVTNRPLKAPAYPMLLMILEKQSSMILGMPMSPDPQDYLRLFTKGLVDLMVKQGRPRRILVRDERTYALLQQICPQIGVQLKRVELIEMLEEALSAYHDQFSKFKKADAEGAGRDDKILQMLKNLEQLPSLEDMPEEMLQYLLQLLSSGTMSEKLVSMVKAEAARRKIM